MAGCRTLLRRVACYRLPVPAVAHGRPLRAAGDPPADTLLRSVFSLNRAVSAEVNSVSRSLAACAGAANKGSGMTDAIGTVDAAVKVDVPDIAHTVRLAVG